VLLLKLFGRLLAWLLAWVVTAVCLCLTPGFVARGALLPDSMFSWLPWPLPRLVQSWRDRNILPATQARIDQLETW
jgi:hypothetical protein